MNNSKRINITDWGDEDGVDVEIYPERVRYNFDSLEEAIEALPNLKEVEQ